MMMPMYLIMILSLSAPVFMVLELSTLLMEILKGLELFMKSSGMENISPFFMQS